MNAKHQKPVAPKFGNLDMLLVGLPLLAQAARRLHWSQDRFAALATVAFASTNPERVRRQGK